MTTRRRLLAVLLILPFLGAAAAAGQDRDATRTPVSGPVVAEYDGFQFNVKPEDGVVCYVVERRETLTDTRMSLACFVNAGGKWTVLDGIPVPGDGQYEGAAIGDGFVPGVAGKVN